MVAPGFMAGIIWFPDDPPHGVAAERLNFLLSTVGFFIAFVGTFFALAYKHAVDIKTVMYVALIFIAVFIGCCLYGVNNHDTIGGNNGLIIFFIVVYSLLGVFAWFVSTRVPAYSEPSQDIPTIVRVYLLAAVVYCFVFTLPGMCAPGNSNAMLFAGDNTETHNEHAQIVLMVFILMGPISFSCACVFLHIFFYPNRPFIAVQIMAFIGGTVTFLVLIGRRDALEANSGNAVAPIVLQTILIVWGVISFFKLDPNQGYSQQK